MKTILLIILIGLTQLNLNSQNYLFEPNSSGFHLAGILGASPGSTILGIRPGYTFNGKLTLGLVVGSENISDLDLNSTVIRPYIDFLALKQSEKDVPISLNLGIHYQHNSFPKVPGLTFNTYGFSLNILHAFEVNQNTSIIPSLGVGWDKTTVSLSGFTEDLSMVGFGLSTAHMLNNLYLEPLLTIHRRSTQFSLSVGIILP